MATASDILQGLLGAAMNVDSNVPSQVYNAKQEILSPEQIKAIGTGLAGKRAQGYSQWNLAPASVREAVTGPAHGAVGAEGMRNMEAIARRGQRLGHEGRSAQVEFARGEQDRATQAANAGIQSDFAVTDFGRADQNRMHEGDKLQELLAQSSTYTEKTFEEDWIQAVLGFLAGGIDDDFLQQIKDALGIGGDGDAGDVGVPGVPGSGGEDGTDGEGTEGDGTEPGTDPAGDSAGGGAGGGGGVLNALIAAGGALGIYAAIQLAKGRKQEGVDEGGNATVLLDEEFTGLLTEELMALFPGLGTDPTGSPYTTVQWNQVPFSNPDVQAMLASEPGLRASFDAFMASSTTQGATPFSDPSQSSWYGEGVEGVRSWFMDSGLADIFAPPDALSMGMDSGTWWGLFFDDLVAGGEAYAPGSVDFGTFTMGSTL